MAALSPALKGGACGGRFSVMKTDMRFMDRLLFLARLTKPQVGVDFLVYTPEEFRQMMEDENLFLKEEVVKKGVVLYDSGGARIHGLA